MKIIQKKINQDILKAILPLGLYSNFQAKIIASRVGNLDTIEKFLIPNLKNISSAFLLKDIDKAIDRIYKAIQNDEVIGIETDHDCDGQTSHAIFYEALTKIFNHPKEKIRSYIGHRMNEGYGLSNSLMLRILNDKVKPTLIITADNGSTDEERIKILKENSIETIVTDHHAIPENGVPKSAYAVINPIQKDCNYSDKYIAGCFIAWLFMAGLRRKFIQENKRISLSYSLVNLLDFVAVGTIADCVSMAKSFNNRIVTTLGIQQIKKNNRKCWQVFEKDKINSEYIGFTIAPLLNSNGRMSNAFGSVNFLLAENNIKEYFDELKQNNNIRKQVQKDITNKALEQAIEIDRIKNSLVIYLEDGHTGVHGISASRIKDKFGKPTIIFSKNKDNGTISGSARSIENIHIKNAFDSINNLNNSIMLKYGGHSGAGGLTIKKENFELFGDLFEKEIIKQIKKYNINLESKIFIDGTLELQDFSLKTYEEIENLEPFGREFEKPIFCNNFIIEKLKFVGKDKNHCQLVLKFQTINIKAIWFNAIDYDCSNKLVVGDYIKVCYELQKEEFMGNTNLSLNIKYIEKLL